MRYSSPPAGTAVALLTLLALSACAPTPLVSSWTSPEATHFQLRGAKVATVVMATNETTRRAAEEALARELAKHGAHGIPMYTLLPDGGPENEAVARAAAERAGVAGVVVMRPVLVDKEISSRPTHSGPMYGGFWGGYYGHGWGSAWGGEIRTDTIVVVETLVYGLRENKLLWAGQSKTRNPRNVDRLVGDTATQVAQELERLGLIAES